MSSSNIIYWTTILCSVGIVWSQNATTSKNTTLTVSTTPSTTATKNVSNDLAASASGPRAVKSRAVSAFSKYELCILCLVLVKCGNNRVRTASLRATRFVFFFFTFRSRIYEIIVDGS